MKRLLQTTSLMTESEKAMKYNQMMNDIIAYKKQFQPQVVLQPPITIPNTPNIWHEVHHQPTMQLVRKRPSLLTPPATVDPANINGYPFRTMKKKKKKKSNVDYII